MNILQKLRRALGDVSRSAQIQAEIREGIANSSDVASQRAKELVLGLENLAEVVDQRFRALKASTDNEAALLNDRLTRLIRLQEAQMERFERLLASRDAVAPMQERSVFVAASDANEALPPIRSTGPSRANRLPMPQFSLRRPDPFADLAVTREFAAYRAQFADAPNSGSLNADGRAVLYALTRKLSPARAICFELDGAAAATIAEAMADAGSGEVVLVGASDETGGMMPDLPADVRGHLRVEASRPATIEPLALAYLDAAWPGAIEAMDALKDRIGAPGALVVRMPQAADEALDEELARLKSSRAIGRGAAMQGELARVGLRVLLWGS